MQFWFRNATWLIACAWCCALLGSSAMGQEMLHDLSEDAYLMGDAEPGYEPDAGYPTPDCGAGFDEGHCGAEWEYGRGEVCFDRHWWGQFCEALRFRHSSRNGRWSGPGQPLRSTSWLNRPFEFNLETGAFVMTKSVSPNNNRNNDVLLAANLGWDWDHYWGTQFRVAWTTPEFISSVPSDSTASNNVLLYDLSLLYYPWGDSRIRPYYRFGFGLTDINFITPAGVREDATLFSMPVGMGIKYQTRRTVALRAEAVDYIAWGQNSASGMNNFTLTFGVEWRFGGRPNRAWSSPSRSCNW